MSKHTHPVLEAFELVTGTTPGQAARLLCVEYPRYMEMRRCVRTIPRMLMASIKAHAMLPPDCLAIRKGEG